MPYNALASRPPPDDGAARAWGAMLIGETLGPYRVTGKLGAGGMGEVYAARDTRLDRSVAIKVLPPQYRTDAELRERFEREARTISSLSHPHICTLFDVGHDRDVDFLVMEHLEGETLAERLARGPLPVAQALDLAVQMARALDTAHRQRVVHRDLKPGNVMLLKASRQGMPQAKLLDFGLARLVPSTPAVDFTLSGRTMTTPAGSAGTPLTARGSILGTLPYMAPEQIEGRDADHRSDIFALGAMLYEMLSGRRPFEGRSHASLMAAILEQDPPPLARAAPSARVPPAVERIIGKCLAKDPDARWQSAGDLADALQWAADIPAGAPAGDRAGWRAGGRAAAGWIAAGVLLVLLLIGAAASWPRPGDAGVTVRRLAIEPGTADTLLPGGLAFSPDGSRLVFAAEADGRGRLYQRALDRLAATPIAGTEEGRAPFFSPDGEWIAFFTPEALKKVSLRGGQPVVLARLPPVARGGAWLPDDTIVFAASQASGLWQIPAAGGEARVLTEPGAGDDDGAHLWPQVLPGGSDLLLTVRTATSSVDAGLIAIHSLDTGERHILVRDGGHARYLPSGHLAFVRGGTLMIAPVDLAGRRLTGTPTPFVEHVLVDGLGGPHFDAARDGTMIYLDGRTVQKTSALVMVDRAGVERSVLQAPGQLISPTLASDGRRVLLTVEVGGTADVWIGDLSRQTLTRLTHSPLDEFTAIWSHDARHVIYTVFPIGEAPKLVRRPADGTGAPERLADAGRHQAQFSGSLSPDGRWLAYTEATARASGDLRLLPLHPGEAPRTLLATPFDEFGPEFSPDGRWIAFTSNESGQYEVYVMPFPGPGARRPVSRGGGVSPAWSADGSEIFYLNGATLHAVPFDGDVVVGEPRALFDIPPGQFIAEDNPRAFAPHPDGRHFLVIRHAEAEVGPPPRLHAILGWPGALARGQQ
jgi:eukaryotic-like serine/threonine-protein kinase